MPEPGSALCRRDFMTGGGAALASMAASLQGRRPAAPPESGASGDRRPGNALGPRHHPELRRRGPDRGPVRHQRQAGRGRQGDDGLGRAHLRRVRPHDRSRPSRTPCWSPPSIRVTPAYIIRAMQLGVDVITEKPLCTDEQQCQAILDAEKKYGRKLTVAFNARHYPAGQEGQAVAAGEGHRRRDLGGLPGVSRHTATAPATSAAGTASRKARARCW